MDNDRKVMDNYGGWQKADLALIEAEDRRLESHCCDCIFCRVSGDSKMGFCLDSEEFVNPSKTIREIDCQVFTPVKPVAAWTKKR